MNPSRWLAVAALVAAAVAAAAWGASRAAKPADPAARVAEARAALQEALDAERAAGAGVVKLAVDAANSAKENGELFDRLGALERHNWSVALVREGKVEAWAGVPPAGVEGWAIEGPAGTWEGSAWAYLWAQSPAAGGRIVATRTLRSRVKLPAELHRNAFAAEEVAKGFDVGVSWAGDGEKADLGGGVVAVLEAPAAAQLAGQAAGGALAVARWAAVAAWLLLVAAASMFFLQPGGAPEAARHVALFLALWGGRGLLLAFDIPGTIFRGPVFDPDLYATLRFLQLARTAGDLAITACVGAIHVALISARGLATIPRRLGLLLPPAFAGVAWIYHWHLVSVVRDSPLDLLDASSALPEGPAAALWFSVAAGSFAFFLSARLAVNAAAEAMEGQAFARGIAAALVAVAALAGFHTLVVLAFVGWLALLVPRRPQIPFVAVGGTLAAAILCGLSIARESDDEARADIAQQAERVPQFADAGKYRFIARMAADALKEPSRDKVPSESDLMEVWARFASRNKEVSLGVASFNGREWSSFAVGMAGWTPGDAAESLPEDDDKENTAIRPKARSRGGQLYFDYTIVDAKKGRPELRLATVRAAAGEGLTSLLRVNAPPPRGITALLQSGSPWTDPRLTKSETEFAPGTQAWKDLDLNGEPFEVLFRSIADEEGQPRVWAFGRRRATLEEAAVRGLRSVFLFALAGIAFALALSVAARIARTFDRDLLGRLEVRLTVALLAVSAIPVGGLAFLAQSLATRPLEQAWEKREEEAATIAMKRAVDETAGQYSAVTDGIVAGVEDLVDRDVFYYYGGRLKAVGQPAFRILEVAPGYVPGTTWREVSLRGGRYRHSPAGVGVTAAGMTWTAGELSRKAVIAVAAAPLAGPSEAGRATSLALGGAALVALLLWPLSALIARRISGPVAALTAAAGKIESGDLSVRVHLPAEGDVADLVAAFNRMTDGLVKGRDALARAERERAWREMARQVAHEIKNPLTPLKLSLQNLLASWKSSDPEFGKQFEESVALTIQQIDLLARIATNFSLFAGKPSRIVDALDLNEVIRDVMGLFRATAPKVTFVEDLESPLLPVKGDRDEIARAFTNLVKNAIQAMPQGGMLTVTSRNEGFEVDVRVRDTGEGIPDEIKGRMFEPYFSTKTEGTGLGLGIVRRVIEDMNGSIRFESAAGKGTTMILKFPASMTRIGPAGGGQK